jgi:Dickkopf N-terminal cysteine-rich region
MVQGGSEFEWQDEVPPLNTDFDLSIQEGAQLFFEANRDCFTESIDFVGARECTIGLATQAQEPSVRAAWDAVGVRGLCPLDNGVWKLGIELPDNGDNVIYVLNETVQKGETVKCELVGTDGDPDLYVKFGSHPDVTYRKKWRQSDCYSDGIGLLEACTTGPAPADDTEVFIGVSATRAVLDYSIKCQIASKRCRGVGMPCSAQSQCCGAFPFALACDGPRVGSTVCKTCLEFDRVCTRTSQCCQGLACRNRRCLLAKDPWSRTRNRRLAFSGRTKCTSIKQCCSTDRFPQTCDGTSAANRYCKTCYKEGRACTRNTECCPKWACLNRQCKKAVIK